MATKPKKYKGLTRPVELSQAAKQAQEREKQLKKIRAGKYKPIASTSASKVMTKAQKRNVLIETFQAKVVPQPPRTAKTNAGLSIAKILKNTPRMMHENGAECAIHAFKRNKTPIGLPVVQAKVEHRDTLRPNATRRIYNVTVIGLDDPNKPISKQKRVMLSCPCENFVYQWEYALAEHGAARIMYGNGEPPSFTNPGHLPGCCKHSVAVLKRIREQGI